MEASKIGNTVHPSRPPKLRRDALLMEPHWRLCDKDRHWQGKCLNAIHHYGQRLGLRAHNKSHGAP
jgi:hypothetical protein